MLQEQLIDCRIAAYAETGCRSGEWSFYLINASSQRIDEAVLTRCGHDLAEGCETRLPNLRLRDIPPGGRALLWRDADQGDRLWLELSVCAAQRRQDLLFEFQCLCQARGKLPAVTDQEPLTASCLPRH